MSIDRTFEGALMKAVRSLEIGQLGLHLKGIQDWSDMKIEEILTHATDQRLFAICEAFRRGMDVEEIHQLTYVDPWFLQKVKDLVELETEFRKHKGEPDEEMLRRAKLQGFNDRYLAEMWGIKETDIRDLRKQWDIQPSYKIVDTCAAEFESETPYLYSTYERENELRMV
jgi:carbamoyl-phosphate synthase large subunit